jgi:hypothetical protein
MPRRWSSARTAEQSNAPSRNGVKASCVQLTPHAASLSAKSLGELGCSDQLHTPNTPARVFLAATVFVMAPTC